MTGNLRFGSRLDSQWKRFGIHISFSIYFMDCVILGLQWMEAELYGVLYGILLILMYTISYVYHGTESGVAA